MMKILFRTIVLASVAATVSAAEYQPPMPYYDWGACPFEGCVYQEWIAKAELNVFKDRDLSSPIVFTLGRREEVNALTGVVITTRPGKVKILEPITLDLEKPVSLVPGDILFTLHYLGEGYWLFWFKGELHSDEIMSPSDVVEKTPRPNAPIQVLSVPETEWWVKLKNSKGIIGWTKETEKFERKDLFE